MAKKYFTVIIEGKQHSVEVKESRFTGRGEILVDGKVVEAWGARLVRPPGEIRFEVAGKPAICIRKLGGLPWKGAPWDFYVAGEKI